MENRAGKIWGYIERTLQNVPMEHGQSYVTEERVRETEKQVLANILYFMDYTYHELSRDEGERELRALRQKRATLLEAEKRALTSLKGECMRLREEVSGLRKARAKGAPVNVSLLGIIEGAVLAGASVAEEDRQEGAATGDADGLQEVDVDVYFTNREIPEISAEEVERIDRLLCFMK